MIRTKNARKHRRDGKGTTIKHDTGETKNTREHRRDEGGVKGKLPWDWTIKDSLDNTLSSNCVWRSRQVNKQVCELVQTVYTAVA